VNSAIESAIARIWTDYSEPLSLNEIAKSAILSRFHFSRVFREATWVSPGRYLSAVRIYQAKHLLATTTLSVTDISLAVGYNSLGSFTNHFTDSVGASPSRFRRMWLEDMRPAAPVETRALPETRPPAGNRVVGTVTLPAEYAAARVYIGAFDTPIIQRRPVSCTVVEATGGVPARYCLPNVTAGEWYVSAVATADTTDPEPWTRRSLLLGGGDPVTVDDDSTSAFDIALRPRRKTDLPVLYAVPNLEPQVANRGSQVVAGPLQAAASRLERSRIAVGAASSGGEPPALGNLEVPRRPPACLQSSRVDSGWRRQ